jgi:peptidoglycan biosynthesis protein MviN/MurJ (putative lipid II flippase)
LDRGTAQQGLSATLASAKHEGLLLARNKKRWKPLWKQRLIVGTLVLADMFLALVVWGAAAYVKSIWGHGELSEVAVASIVPSVIVWVGLRALLGLYPG